jgi:hypothetical protein
VPFDDSVYDTLETVGDVVEGAGLTAGGGSVVSSFFFGASLNLAYGLLHMIQMYVHFPLLHINFPGNIFGILKIFINIA